MIKTLDQLKARKKEILALLADDDNADIKLLEELPRITEQIKKAKDEREDDIVNVVQGISNLNLTFAELMAKKIDGRPLFQSVDIMDYARGQGWKFAGASSHDIGIKTVTKRGQKEGLKLIEVQPPGQKGFPFRLFKGDKFPQIFGAKLVWLAQQPGKLEEILMAYSVKSQEAQEYLASDEGKAELQKWMGYIKENAPKINTAKKDGGKQEPAAQTDGKQPQTAKHK